MIVSVERIQLTLTSAASDNQPLTLGQTIANCVPFYSVKGVTGESFADININDFVEVTFSGSSVYATRTGTVGTMVVDVYVVEFDPSFVKVQQYSLDIPSGTSNTQAITAVSATTAAFLIYTYLATDVTDDKNDGLTKVKFNSTSQVQVDRGAAGGTIEGTLYVVEALGAGPDFSVQHYELTVGNPEYTTQVVSPSVTLALSFIMGSHLTSAGDDAAEQASIKAWLSSVAELRIERISSTPASTCTAACQVVSLDSDADNTVQHGEFSFIAQDPSENYASLTTIDVTRAIAIVQPFPTGGSGSGAGTNNWAESYVGTYLSGTNTIYGERFADYGATCTARWSVIEWKEAAAGAAVGSLILDGAVLSSLVLEGFVVR